MADKTEAIKNIERLKDTFLIRKRLVSKRLLWLIYKGLMILLLKTDCP